MWFTDIRGGMTRTHARRIAPRCDLRGDVACERADRTRPERPLETFSDGLSVQRRGDSPSLSDQARMQAALERGVQQARRVLAGKNRQRGSDIDVEVRHDALGALERAQDGSHHAGDQSDMGHDEP
ncbi:hypothetical protein ASA1KI_26520 [Opitutales bacterium ASA1]|nr:hypothetical protein ASA1KI_26520 [Opitutales bacterium ASA1]